MRLYLTTWTMKKNILMKQVKPQSTYVSFTLEVLPVWAAFIIHLLFHVFDSLDNALFRFDVFEGFINHCTYSSATCLLYILFLRFTLVVCHSRSFIFIAV